MTLGLGLSLSFTSLVFCSVAFQSFSITAQVFPVSLEQFLIVFKSNVWFNFFCPTSYLFSKVFMQILFIGMLDLKGVAQLLYFS